MNGLRCRPWLAPPRRPDPFEAGVLTPFEAGAPTFETVALTFETVALTGQGQATHSSVPSGNT